MARSGGTAHLIQTWTRRESSTVVRALDRALSGARTFGREGRGGGSPAEEPSIATIGQSELPMPIFVMLGPRTKAIETVRTAGWNEQRVPGSNPSAVVRVAVPWVRHDRARVRVGVCLLGGVPLPALYSEPDV